VLTASFPQKEQIELIELTFSWVDAEEGM
jgi:hypothetical protein